MEKGIKVKSVQIFQLGFKLGVFGHHWPEKYQFGVYHMVNKKWIKNYLNNLSATKQNKIWLSDNLKIYFDLFLLRVIVFQIVTSKKKYQFISKWNKLIYLRNRLSKLFKKNLLTPNNWFWRSHSFWGNKWIAKTNRIGNLFNGKFYSSIKNYNNIAYG